MQKMSISVIMMSQHTRHCRDIGPFVNRYFQNKSKDEMLSQTISEQLPLRVQTVKRPEEHTVIITEEEFQKICKIKAGKLTPADFETIEGFERFLDYACSFEILCELICKYPVEKLFIKLLRQGKNSRLQFISLNLLKKILDQIIAQSPNTVADYVVTILNVFFSQLTSPYSQLSNQILLNLKRIFTITPEFAPYFANQKTFKILNDEIHKYFEVDEKQLKASARKNMPFGADSLIIVLNIFELLLNESAESSQITKIPIVVLKTIQYIFTKPINPQFAIRLISVMRLYSINKMVDNNHLLFIFNYPELLLRILKSFTFERVDILNFFMFGVSLQKHLPQATEQDMLYCLQMLLRSDQLSSKQAFWNILSKNNSKSCIEGILKRKSLVNLILEVFESESQEYKLKIANIINFYIEYSNFNFTHKTTLVIKIVEVVIIYLSEKQVKDIMIGLQFLCQILDKANLFNEKCRQFIKIGGLSILGRHMELGGSEANAIRQKAQSLSFLIKTAFSDEMSESFSCTFTEEDD